MTNAVEVEEAHATVVHCAGNLDRPQEDVTVISTESLVAPTPTCRATGTAALRDAVGHPRPVDHRHVRAHHHRGVDVVAHLLSPRHTRRRREDARFLGSMIEGQTGAVTDADLAP